MGFDLLEYVKKSNYENTALIAPAGYGKTTLLKKCFILLSQEKFVVPCYIDINNLAGKGIYEYIQNNYFGSIDLSSNNFESSFINAIKSENAYRYIFLIDNLENVLLYSDKNFYKSILSFFSFAKSNNNCAIIVGSTYCDELIDGFNVIKLSPLNTGEIITALQNQIGVGKMDYNHLDVKLYSVLSKPYNLKKYINLLKSDFDKYVNLNSEYEILNNSLSEVENKYDYFNLVPKIAFYFAKRRYRYASEDVIQDLFSFPIKTTDLSRRIHDNLKKAGITPFNINNIDDFYYYFENIVCRKQKVISVLGVNENRVIVFDSQILVDFFASKYIKNKLKHYSKDTDILNDYLMSDIVTKFLADQLYSTDILKLKMKLKKCSRYRTEPIKTANIVNILYYYNNESFENFNLSRLNLKYVNFIGKNCQNVDFSNSCFVSECFIPCIFNDITLYSISDNGDSFAIGNKNSAFFIESKSGMIYSTIFSENKEIEKLEFISSYGFVVIYSDDTAEVINGVSSYTIKNTKELNELFLPKNNVDIDVDDYKLYGKLCASYDNKALFYSTPNSYFGEAYILVFLGLDRILAFCPIKPHTKLSYVVQNDNEIECLIENAGKPLKSVCFNDSTKEIYYKQYSSLVGKYIKYSGETKILFDTENINDFIKWYFLNEKLHEYKNEKVTFEISNVKSDFPICFRGHYKYIHTASERFVLQIDGESYNFDKNALIHNNHYRGCGLSCENYYVSEHYVSRLIIREYGTERYIEIYKKYLPSINSYNILNIKNEKFVFCGNDIYKVNFNDEKGSLNYVKKIPLSFNDEYLYAINNFPWSEAIKIAFEKYNVTLEEDFEKVVKDIVSESLKPIIKELKENLCEFNGERWADAFSSYIEKLIISIIRSQNDILSDEQYIIGFKSFCFPCDSGINYYNGKSSCFIQLDDDFNVQYEIEYKYSCSLLDYRSGVHYCLETNCYNQTNNIELWDIYKSQEQNIVEKPIIPIYDLNLYGANFEGAYWIDENGNVLDIIQKQTKIQTVNAKMNIVYD